jgi:transcriptional regulator with XRE-family HTH domain
MLEVVMVEIEQAVASRLDALMSELEVVGYRAIGVLCGTSANVVSNWMNGYNLPRVPEMIRLCEKTGVTLDWIYRGRAGSMDAKLVMRLTGRPGAAPS